MKKIVVAAVCLCLSACVTVKNAPMGEAAAGSLQGQSIAHTARKKPAFSAMTAGKAMFGGLGAVAMITEGNAIIEKNNVDDPANAIAEGLTQALAAKHGSTVAAVVDDLEGSRSSRSPPAPARRAMCSTYAPSTGRSSIFRPTGIITGFSTRRRRG